VRVWNGAHVRAGNYIIIFLDFCDFPLIEQPEKCHVLFSFTGCAPHTLAHPEYASLPILPRSKTALIVRVLVRGTCQT